MNKTMKFGVVFCKYVVNKNIDGNANPVKHKKSLIRLRDVFCTLGMSLRRHRNVFCLLNLGIL